MARLLKTFLFVEVGALLLAPEGLAQERRHRRHRHRSSEPISVPTQVSPPTVVSAPIAPPAFAPPAMLCIPGQQLACACGGGVQGYQACAAGGMSYSPCVCPAVTVPEPSVPLIRSLDDGTLRQPISFTNRPLTIPRFTLRPILDLTLSKGFANPIAFVSGGSLGSASLSEVFQVVLGAQFGVTDDFEVGLDLLPFYLSPRAAFGDMRLALTYRFARGSFDAGLVSALGIATGEGTTSLFQFGFPMRWRSPTSRTDIAFLFSTPLRGDFKLGLNIPFMQQFAINEVGHLGFTTGFSMTWTPGRSNFDRTFAVPLGLAGGYTMRGTRGPVVDVDAYLQFPAFLNTFRDRIEASFESYVFGVTASLYLYL